MAIDTPTSPTGTETAPTGRPVAAASRLAALFPDPSAPAPSWWRRRRAAIAVALVVVLVVVAVVAAQAFGASDPSYVTATVATHDVASLYNGVGVVEPVSQATVAFPASGTVAAVDVKLGDSVTIGQALASLDPQALAQTLHEKQATLAQAELTLQKALDGQSVGGIGSGSTGSSRTNGSTGSPTGASAASASGSTAGSGSTVVLTAMTIPRSGNPQIAKAQQEVLAAQHQVDAAVDTATQAVDSATTICAAAGVGSSSPSTPTPAQLEACQTAMKNVQTAQAAVTTAQQQLVAASTALDTLLGQEANTPATTPSTTPSSGSRTGSGSGTGTSRPSTGSSAASSSPTAADLAAYQQAVDAAAADVAVAEQAIAQATIVSPIAGTVEAVNLAVGDTVSAGSTTANIVVVGAGGYEVTTTVSVDQVPEIKVGQPATFVPDGAKRPLSGTVASISIAPATSTSSTTGTTSYRVVVGLTDPDAALDNGSTGSIAIVTKTARAALAVPTSAVTPIGTRHTVTVLDGGTATRTVVQVGVVGTTWTEITGGLKAGQKVVLANLDEPLPGSATSSSNGTNTNTNGAGGFRFGGAFPGGGGGGAFPGGFTRGGGG